MRHSFVSSRPAGLALVLAAVVAGCGGGEDGRGGSSGTSEAAARMEQAAAVQAPAPVPARRAPVDPLLRSTNAAASQVVQLKCQQKFEARARNHTLAYGDRMRQRRLTDICTNLAALPG